LNNGKLSKDVPLHDFGLWKKHEQPFRSHSLDIKLKACRYLNYRDCYINQPVGDNRPHFFCFRMPVLEKSNKNTNKIYANNYIGYIHVIKVLSYFCQQDDLNRDRIAM